MDTDFAVSCPLVRRWRLISGFCPSTRTFDPCFFQTPPRGGSPCIITRPSPPSGWPEDLHLQAAEHAQHTTKPLARRTLRVEKLSGRAPPMRCPCSGPQSAVTSTPCLRQRQLGALDYRPKTSTKVPKHHSKPIHCRVRRKRKRLTSNGSIESDAAFG